MSVLIIISGPSGAGKETLITKLEQDLPAFNVPVHHTTRAPREGEIEGHRYHFVSKEEFEKKIADNLFVEFSEHFGNFYGTTVSALKDAMRNGDVVLEVDVNGAFQIRKKIPQAQLIFISPPSLEELEKRLRSRGKDSDESIRNRLARAEREMGLSIKYNYTIVNNVLSEAISELEFLVTNLRKNHQK